MAVNHADGMMFASVVFYPIVATKAALSADAGWIAAFFIPAGLAVGVGVTYVGRKIIYSMMECGLKRTEAFKGWVQQIVGMPMLLLYLILPLAIPGAGIYGTWLGSVWLVRRIL